MFLVVAFLAVMIALSVVYAFLPNMIEYSRKRDFDRRMGRR